MMRTLDQVDAEQIYRKAECSARELRNYLQLDFVIPVTEAARRPKCEARIDALCQELHGDTIGRGFSITVFGCVCHRCRFPSRVSSVRFRLPKPPTKKRNRWDGYVRPSHKCECGKPIAEQRAKHCLSCACKLREQRKRAQKL